MRGPTSSAQSSAVCWRRRSTSSIIEPSSGPVQEAADTVAPRGPAPPAGRLAPAAPVLWPRPRRPAAFEPSRRHRGLVRPARAHRPHFASFALLCAGDLLAQLHSSRSRGRASATASTARSRRTRPTSTTPDEVERLLEEAVRRNAKELLVLTESGRRSIPAIAERLREWGHEDFTSYVVWACQKGLDARQCLSPHEPGRPPRART